MLRKRSQSPQDPSGGSAITCSSSRRGAKPIWTIRSDQLFKVSGLVFIKCHKHEDRAFCYSLKTHTPILIWDSLRLLLHGFLLQYTLISGTCLYILEVFQNKSPLAALCVPIVPFAQEGSSLRDMFGSVCMVAIISSKHRGK